MTSQVKGILRGMDSISLNTGRHLEREMQATRERSQTRMSRSWGKVAKALEIETLRYQ